MSAKQILLHHLAQDDLPKVLKGLMFLADKYKDEQVRNNATFQSGRLKALEKQIISGTLSQEEEHLQSAKIREAILHIIQGLPDDWTLGGMENAPASFNSSSKRNWKKYAAIIVIILLIVAVILELLGYKISGLFPQKYIVYIVGGVSFLAGIAELTGYSLRDIFKKGDANDTSEGSQSARTEGKNSPAVIAKGDVNISYGEPMVHPKNRNKSKRKKK